MFFYTQLNKNQVLSRVNSNLFKLWMEKNKSSKSRGRDRNRVMRSRYLNHTTVLNPHHRQWMAKSEAVPRSTYYNNLHFNVSGGLRWRKFLTQGTQNTSKDCVSPLNSHHPFYLWASRVHGLHVNDMSASVISRTCVPTQHVLLISVFPQHRLNCKQWALSSNIL